MVKRFIYLHSSWHERHSYSFASDSKEYSYKTQNDLFNTSINLGSNSILHVVETKANANMAFAKTFYGGPMPDQSLEVGTQRLTETDVYHYMQGSGNYPINFHTNDTIRMSVKADGNIAINKGAISDFFSSNTSFANNIFVDTLNANTLNIKGNITYFAGLPFTTSGS